MKNNSASDSVLGFFRKLLKAYMARSKAAEAGFNKFRFWVIFLVLAVPVGYVAHQYAIQQARLHTPIEGQIFPREPLIKGTYYYEVLRGREQYRSRLDQTSIFCGTFSYFDGTWAQSGGSRVDCKHQMLGLEGKEVEVERVRLPRDNKGSRVVKITSEGKVYCNLSDAQVRDLWIRDTNIDIKAVPLKAVGHFSLFAGFTIVFFNFCRKIVTYFIQRRRQHGNTDRSAE